MVASPTVPLPRRLFAHLRRWVANGIVSEYFVEWNGRPVKSVKTAFKTALRLAKVSGRISPHTLRHTAATWLMQNGVDKWEAAGFLGMSVEMLDRVYGHHHPEHLPRWRARARLPPVAIVGNNVGTGSAPTSARQTTCWKCWWARELSQLLA
jgi:integrase